ncbi:hypothetical protein HGRIS_013806 [Hohenbuehelia grisea]|uniref:Uncharacterized protein n=1 Tax=Hohenbuehelia grisea TaxID=104357 RepID=A0ABR3IWP0_9AGAR
MSLHLRDTPDPSSRTASFTPIVEPFLQTRLDSSPFFSQISFEILDIDPAYNHGFYSSEGSSPPLFPTLLAQSYDTLRDLSLHETRFDRFEQFAAIIESLTCLRHLTLRRVWYLDHTLPIARNSTLSYGSQSPAGLVTSTSLTSIHGRTAVDDALVVKFLLSRLATPRFSTIRLESMIFYNTELALLGAVQPEELQHLSVNEHIIRYILAVIPRFVDLRTLRITMPRGDKHRMRAFYEVLEAITSRHVREVSLRWNTCNFARNPDPGAFDEPDWRRIQHIFGQERFPLLVRIGITVTSMGKKAVEKLGRLMPDLHERGLLFVSLTEPPMYDMF